MASQYTYLVNSYPVINCGCLNLNFYYCMCAWIIISYRVAGCPFLTDYTYNQPYDYYICCS